ncbi:MAG: sodium/proton antiporter NhaB [Pseudomonadota bacterium]
MIASGLYANFLGDSPNWYKLVIIGCLIFNPVILFLAGPVFLGWLLIFEFIFTLVMALKCYPLQPGGLLAIQAVALGLTSAHAVAEEVSRNFPVILLLIFMVAAIYFMKDLLLFIFTKILLNVRNKSGLAFLFCFLAAILSAFLDALTVIAVVISVGLGFYTIYHRAASGNRSNESHDSTSDHHIEENNQHDLEKFRSFLRSLLMHAGVGTTLGGVTTMVGEPQNLLIAKTVEWSFTEFFIQIAPVSLPVLVVGLFTCILLEHVKWFGYGETLPDSIRTILENHDKKQTAQRTQQQQMKLIIQGCGAILLIFCLAFQVAEVGLIGLALIVFQTAFNGVTEEHAIGRAFQEALPFTALLVVFFTIVAIIHDQHLFAPMIQWVLSQPESSQTSFLFIANGVLSMISDNVFVATIYISEVKQAFDQGLITRDHLDQLAIAINVGTNIPSIATPNGQAAFLFLLTSSIAPLIRLSYGKMVWMALPYTLILSVVSFACVYWIDLIRLF